MYDDIIIECPNCGAAIEGDGELICVGDVPWCCTRCSRAVDYWFAADRFGRRAGKTE